MGLTEKKVNLVKYDLNEESFYDVYPIISKSLETMRNKIIGVQGIKWGWHVVLTYKPVLRNMILKNGGMSGSELLKFLNRTRTIVDKNRKYFWKYEEGTKGSKPHFHLLFDFRKDINVAWVAQKIYKRKWKEGAVDFQKIVRSEKKYKMNYGKSDVEILMGLLLKRKWNNGIVFARKIKGLGKEHQKNLVYYVNKDLMKPSTYNCMKKGANKWGFGKGYKFKEVKMFNESKMVSPKYAIHKMMTTKDKFIKYYDSMGMNGLKLFFKRIRDIKKGKYFRVVK